MRSGLESLKDLCSIRVDQLRINVGDKTTNERFTRLVKRAQALAQFLIESEDGEAMSEPLAPDIAWAVDILRRGEGSHLEIQNQSAIFSRMDSLVSALSSAAAAYGAVVVGSKKGMTAFRAFRPFDDEWQQRTEKLSAEVKQIQDAISPEAITKVRQSLTEIQDAHATMKRLLSEASKDATTLKVGDYHQFFVKTAERHRKSAKKWLWVTVLSALSTVATAFWFVASVYSPSYTPLGVEGSIARAIAVTVMVSATVWAGLNYRSHQHNAVVNEHRGDALGSFDAFWNAALSEEAKDAVLVQASNAIYLAQPSGFVGRDGDANTSGIGVLAGLMASRHSK